MKLLLENWQGTYWKTDYGKVTIGEIIDDLGDKTVDINVGELIEQLPTLPVGGGKIDEALNRMAAASLDYPIIIVKNAEKYQYVLDGNHRLGKAYVYGGKDSTIKAKILDLDDSETPEKYKRMFK